MSVETTIEDKNSKGSRKFTYAQTFESMLEVLLFAVFREDPISWKDLSEHVSDKDRPTLNRYLRSLEAQGYLERKDRVSNKVHTYVASEKSKQLFGVKV